MDEQIEIYQCEFLAFNCEEFGGQFGWDSDVGRFFYCFAFGMVSRHAAQNGTMFRSIGMESFFEV